MSHGIGERLRLAGCVWAEDEADLLIREAPDAASLQRLVERRCAGEPLEYILGWAEFLGLRIVVQPGIFIPRRRTEALARQAIALCRPGGLAVDLCCGSGAVAAAITAACSDVEVHAGDIDPGAVACAGTNLGPANVHQGDLWTALPARLRGRCDVVVANAPYVPSDQLRLLPSEARGFEHPVGLDGGADGLAVHRRIAAGAGEWIRPGGWLLFEVGTSQQAEACAILAEAGMEPTALIDDDLEVTVVTGHRR